jgi:hypothetical protein
MMHRDLVQVAIQLRLLNLPAIATTDVQPSSQSIVRPGSQPIECEPLGARQLVSFRAAPRRAQQQPW